MRLTLLGKRMQSVAAKAAEMAKASRRGDDFHGN
jgi:hypothetical protein